MLNCVIMYDNIVDVFKEKYKSFIQNDELERLIQAMHDSSNRYVRLNSARFINYKSALVNKPTLKNELSNNNSSPLNTNNGINNDLLNIVEDCCEPHLPEVYKISDYNAVINSVPFITGGCYIQSPSSFLVSKILVERLVKDAVELGVDVDNDEFEPYVLDLCSAPGGKTLAVSELLKRRGVVVANEVSKTRIKSLIFNVNKYSAYNVVVTNFDGRVVHKEFGELRFDAILLDAPCSNENKLFVSNEVKNSWLNDTYSNIAGLQRELIDSAVQLLKPNGLLLFSTCTFDVDENERNVDYILKTYDDLELVKIPQNEIYSKGISGLADIDEKVLRLMPYKDKYNGFFIALLRKKGVVESFAGQLVGGNHQIRKSSSSINVEKELAKIVDWDKLSSRLQHYNISINPETNEGYINHNRKLSFKSNAQGIKAIKFIQSNKPSDVNSKVELGTTFLWEFGDTILEEFRINVSYDVAIKVLRGNDITIQELDDIEKQKILDNDKYKYFYLFYNGSPVSTVKINGTTLKNKLYSFLRLTY